MIRQLQTSDLRQVSSFHKAVIFRFFLGYEQKHHNEIIYDVVNVRFGHDLIVINNKHSFKLNLDFSRIEINC